MRTWLTLVIPCLSLMGCERDAISVAGENFKTWELIEIRQANGDWMTVPEGRKHFLTFINARAVEYRDDAGTCTGKYTSKTKSLSEENNRITFYVPCMVPAEHMWWEYNITILTANEVIAIPRLNPTAMLSRDQYKYRLLQP